MPVSSPRNKRTRQYRHVVKSDRDRGRSEERAREVAVRTAMAQRRDPASNGSRVTAGNALPFSLEDRSAKQLRDHAAELSIRGRSKMRKQDLIRAIREALH